MRSDPTMALTYIMALFVCAVKFGASGDQKNITAKLGEPVTLPCVDPNITDIIAVNCTRLGLLQYVFLYRDGRSDPLKQHPSFKERVVLKDEQMKNGNVSLVLGNVRFNDTGIYRCYVQSGNKSRKKASFDTEPICIIDLTVINSGGEAGDTKDEGDKGGGNKDEGDNGGGHKDGQVALPIGLLVLGLLVIAGVVLWVMYFRRRRPREQNSYNPPAEQADHEAERD